MLIIEEIIESVKPANIMYKVCQDKANEDGTCDYVTLLDFIKSYWYDITMSAIVLPCIVGVIIYMFLFSFTELELFHIISPNQSEINSINIISNIFIYTINIELIGIMGILGTLLIMDSIELTRIYFDKTFQRLKTYIAQKLNFKVISHKKCKEILQHKKNIDENN